MENNSERKVVTEVRSLSLEEIELNLTMIPEKEQKVLELRYGLDGGNIRTQKEVAEILGISVSSVNEGFQILAISGQHTYGYIKCKPWI